MDADETCTGRAATPALSEDQLVPFHLAMFDAGTPPIPRRIAPISPRCGHTPPSAALVMARLPNDDWANMFGWQEIAGQIADACRTLTPADKGLV